MMEWEKQPPQQAEEPSGGGGMVVKVMTDEQMEVLRKQISVYATICEQLVELHRNLTSQNDLSGVRLGNLYCDPLIASGAHKITGRQRWTPTPMQLQILERIFDQGVGTPSKQKIKDITTELSQYGQISETNVYNWFQSRRARSKRKQQAPPANNAASEVETEVESSNEKKSNAKEFQPRNIMSSTSEDLCFQNPQSGSAVHSPHLAAIHVSLQVPRVLDLRLGLPLQSLPIYRRSHISSFFPFYSNLSSERA